MLTSIFLCCLLRISITLAAAAAPPLQQPDIEQRAAMQEKVQSFVQSLDLVPSQNLSLISSIESAQNGDSITLHNLHLACQVAQASLGPSSVESNSVNLTEVDANWSVFPLLYHIANC